MPRESKATRSDRELVGNRLWLTPAPGGPVLQKLYGRRRGRVRSLLRRIAVRLGGRKTSYSASARCRTERRLLRLWREAGFDAPRDLSDRHPHLAGPRTLVMEFVPAPVLGHLLRETHFDREERSDLLRRFAAVWGARHRAALDRSEPGLIQEHGGFDHVLVHGDRFVHFDFEQAWRPRRDLVPLVGKEIASYLSALCRRTDRETFRQDLVAIVEGYPHRDLLESAVRDHVGRPVLGRRVFRFLDRAQRRLRGVRSRKYASMRELREVLRAVK